MADPHGGGEGIGQLHETASGGTGSVDTVMHEPGAGGGGGSAAGQQVPAVADAAGAIAMEENERVRRAAEAAWVAGGSSQADILVKGALMVRGSLSQAQRLAALLGVDAQWREQIGDSQRSEFQLFKLSERLAAAAAAREANGWLRGPNGEFLWRLDVARTDRYKLAATDAPVRPPAEPRMPGAPGCRPANAWLRPNPFVHPPAQHPAPPPAMELSMITEAVSKEVAATVKELLEQHREQEVARLQAALQTAQQAAQTAQQAAQQAAAQTAEHKAQIHQLREELTAVKARMAAMRQADAPGPGEPHPPPKWMPNTEPSLRRQDKLLSSLVQELRGGVAESKAAQLEVVGKLGNVAGKLDQVTTKLNILEQSRQLKTVPSRPLSTSRRSQQGKSPAFAGAEVVDAFAQLPTWPPTGVADWVSPTGPKLTSTSSPSLFQFGPPATATEAGGAATMPPSQLVQEPPPDSDPESESTDEEDARAGGVSDGVCYFSEYGATDDEKQPGGVYEVTPKLDSGSTTPTKPRLVPAPNVRACSKSSPRRPKIKRPKSPGNTPSREVVVRQNATEPMDEDVMRWAIAAADPRKELLF